MGRVRPKPLSEAQLAQRRAARQAKTDKGNPAQELRLAEIARAAVARRAEGAVVDPGFSEATFLATFKKAAITSGGGWAVILEVPYADVDAFFPVSKALDIELVVKVLRKPTARRQATGA